MDLRKIRKLVELMEENGLSELEVESGVGAGSERVRIARPARASFPVSAVPVASAPVSDAPTARGTIVAAPLSGTFYRAPAPGETPFVEVGDKVAIGDVLCIIESMKMMNRIESERAGEVVAVLVEDGKPIETGTGLFRIR